MIFNVFRIIEVLFTIFQIKKIRNLHLQTYKKCRHMCETWANLFKIDSKVLTHTRATSGLHLMTSWTWKKGQTTSKKQVWAESSFLFWITTISERNADVKRIRSWKQSIEFLTKMKILGMLQQNVHFWVTFLLLSRKAHLPHPVYTYILCSALHCIILEQ